MNIRFPIAAFALMLAAPALAQDEPAEVVPVEEAAVEEVAAEEAAADGAPEEPAEPWQIYVGADYVNTTLSRSGPGTAPAAEFDSAMIRVRAGKRVLESVGFELHYGVDQADGKKGEVATDAYYGAYVVPTATVFDLLELAFPVGYGRSEFGDSREALGSIAYGLHAEMPGRALFSGLPDLRLTGGWMVYYQKSDARVYGANFGLRYDFSF